MPLRLRDAVASDYDLYVRLFPELGVDDPIPPAEIWEREQRATTIVVEEGGAALGYSFYRTLATTGYVHNIVVAPGARGRGVGRALMDEMAARFRAAGMADWCLNVKPDNGPAIRLYEGCGMRPRYDSTVLRIRWSQVDALPAAPDGVAATPVAREDADEIEASLGLLPGKVLRRALQPEGRVPMQLRDTNGRVIGYADFAPQFPGAYPFRVSTPALGGALLRALRPFALPEHDRLQVVVEDDPGTASLLRAAGAAVYLEIRHYRGPLPHA